MARLHLLDNEVRNALGGVQEPTWEAAAPELQHAIDGLRVELGAPGMQVSIREDGRARWSGVSGSVGDGQTALSPQHVFRIGSITKTFTAALVLQLVREGALGLEDSLARWFPRFPNADRIRIRHLLEHSSGIRELLERKSFLARAGLFPRHHFSSDEVIRYVAGARPYFAPGSAYRYSNSNYVLLGAIAERLMDSSASSLIRARLLAPLYLRHTSLLPDDSSRLPPPGLIAGLDRDHFPIPGSYRVDVDNTAWATLAFTSGAMASTADDLATWLDALMHGAIVPDFAIAAVTSVREAHDPAIPELVGYGLGLERLVIYGDEWFGHLGDFIGFGGAVLHSPRLNRTIAVLGNMSSFPGVDAVRGVACALAHVDSLHSQPASAAWRGLRENRVEPARSPRWN